MPWELLLFLCTRLLVSFGKEKEELLCRVHSSRSSLSAAGAVRSEASLAAVETRRIGAIVTKSAGGSNRAAEVQSVINLAVELVNNHSDGWYDDLSKVNLVHTVINRRCNFTSGANSMRLLNSWANK